MKILALLSLLVATHAQAAQPEILTQVEINGTPTAFVGLLKIDSRKKSIRLEIYNDPCQEFTREPGGIHCMAVAMMVTSLEVPLQEQSVSCGSKIYSGRRDDRPRDGSLTEITAYDHRGRLCKDIVSSPFLVKASRTNPWTNKTETYFLMQ